MTGSETTDKSRRIDDESDEDASEAQAQVIASLRAQVTDLFSQVTQLNGKLVASYDRMSNLEDQLHDASSSLRNASLTISSLELERTHHLAALNTGLLVEKAHVTAELNRLMERATEEAAQRGQAESARQDIEKDLDDLSASLFDQANTMVAEARLSQARSERKVQDAEHSLKIAEDAVKDMQVQMQSLQAANEAAEREAREARLTVGVERADVRGGDVPRIRFMTTHTPYAEFLAFVAHLNGLRVSQSTPPLISTLTSQPFIARLLTEDSEPTVRLDLAPSLNWLSRRSVLAAIYTGMLTVEPWSFSSLVQELHRHPQSMSSSTLLCALCGAFIARLPPVTPVQRSHNSNGGSWFKYPLAIGSTQNHNADTPSAECELPGQVYIFRLAHTASTPPSGPPPMHNSSPSLSAVGAPSWPPLNTISSSRVLPTQTQNSPYPLCTSNYCLTRLRSTCSLWAFVRVGIVERVWEEEVVQTPKLHVNGATLETPSPVTSANANTTSQPQPAKATTPPSTVEKPPVPPRRRRLWEMASALSERAVSWSKESGEIAREKEREKEKENDGTKKLPTPPPSHPSVPHPHAAESLISRVDAAASGPPPLPKRNVVRDRATPDMIVSPSDTQNAVVTAATDTGVESAAKVNGHVDPNKTDSSVSDASAISVEEITFGAPPSPPLVPAEPSPPPPNEDHPPPPLPSPPSPRNVPLPISRVTSPVPRPRSRVSSPATPPPTQPPSSRPASPAINRSRAGSPVPAPGHVPGASVSHIRGKTSVSSPLAMGLARPASPARPVAGASGAPPLPRRAPARRAVPPPPSPSEARVIGKEENVLPTVVTADDSTPEAQVRKSGEAEAEETGTRTRTSDWDGEGEGRAEMAKETESESESPVAGPTTTTTEAAPEPAKDTDVGAGNVKGQEGVSSTSAVCDPDADSIQIPPPAASEGDARTHTSMDTMRTKRSSSTEGEGEGFAGDATWEERTWKELMRLKEDMYWARIGGIRVLQG